MSGIILDTKNPDAITTQENFEIISEYINQTPILAGAFESYEIDVTNTSSVIKFRHGLNFAPRDVFITWINPTSTVVIRYDLIDETYLAFTSSAECRVRMIAGRVP